MVTHAADAAKLIDALSPEPAFAFGSSIGALIGLALVGARPERVRLLVAHEPPAYRLLQGEEQEEALRSHRELYDMFQREGVPAALKLMIARSGVKIADREPEVAAPMPPSDPQVAAQRAADLEYFFRCDVPAVFRHQPDRAALIAAKPRIVPAVGAGSVAAGSGPTHVLTAVQTRWPSCGRRPPSNFLEATPAMSSFPRLPPPNSPNCSSVDSGSESLLFLSAIWIFEGDDDPVPLPRTDTGNNLIEECFSLLSDDDIRRRLRNGHFRREQDLHAEAQTTQ